MAMSESNYTKNVLKHDTILPRGALIGGSALVIGSLLLVGIVRISGYKPEEAPASTPVEVSELRFEDRPNGAIAIYTSADNRLVDTLAPGTNGFVRGVMRGLVRDRRAEDVGEVPPFRLTRWADGRLSLDDPSTGRHVDLEVFGPTNAGAFADILVASSHSKDKS
jgi:putative photosynthetic complex assembly protein